MTERFIYTCQPVVKRWLNSMSMHPLQYYGKLLFILPFIFVALITENGFNLQVGSFILKTET